MSTLTRHRRATTPPRSSRLSTRASLVLLASLVVALLASSAAPTPLYAIYQASGASPRSPPRWCSGCTRWRCWSPC